MLGFRVFRVPLSAAIGYPTSNPSNTLLAFLQILYVGFGALGHLGFQDLQRVLLDFNRVFGVC